MSENIAKKVFIGMSGGVDSSVSAALLKEAGYDVTGVFIRVWQPEFIECTWKADREDAMRVCSKLGIPFKTLNLEEDYKKYVVDYMIAEYKKGRTPNPDVMCNMYVKFGKFFDWALGEGADYVATGHYARISPDDEIHKLPNLKLLRGIDENKDQTYFLWKLSGRRLSKILFPVGDMLKEETRKKAAELGLDVASKKDSVGVCFIGEMDMKEFLSHFLSLKSGDVLNSKGEVIGTHDGAMLYTLGQRRGFEVRKKGPNEGAHYVIDKNIDANTITVASLVERDNKEEKISSIEIEDTNWILEEPKEGKEVFVRFRHRQPLIEANIESHNPTVVKFNDPQTSVNPGQSLVVYDGEVCLGGGVIGATKSQ